MENGAFVNANKAWQLNAPDAQVVITEAVEKKGDCISVGEMRS